MGKNKGKEKTVQAEKKHEYKIVDSAGTCLKCNVKCAEYWNYIKRLQNKGVGYGVVCKKLK